MTQEIIKIVGIVRNAGTVKEIRLAEDDDSTQERDVIYIKMEKKFMREIL